jgi:hypothetical protein
MNPNIIYYIQNRPGGVGLNASSSPMENYIPVFWMDQEDNPEMEIPEDVIKISQEDYIDFCRNPGEFLYDGETVRRATDEEKADAEVELNRIAEEKRNEPDAIRRERLDEFKLFDKYNYLQKDLTADQIREFEEWRESWKDAPETKIRPDRPAWFREI